MHPTKHGENDKVNIYWGTKKLYTKLNAVVV